MRRILIIPALDEMEKSLEISDKYGTGFEFDDFFRPDILDSEEDIARLTARINGQRLPGLRTVHGAFIDVSVFSPDRRIREISDLRVRQSISAARGIGAIGTVFHTNHNPFLNTREYIDKWLDENEKYWSGILKEFPDMDIYLENMFDSSPRVLAELSERLCGYGNYGVCLDYAHSALTGVPQEQWAESLGRYVRHIHINDNDLISDRHMAIGEGKIDFSLFYRLFEKHMSGASVLIEVNGADKQTASLERLRADGFIDRI